MSSRTNRLILISKSILPLPGSTAYSPATSPTSSAMHSLHDIIDSCQVRTGRRRGRRGVKSQISTAKSQRNHKSQLENLKTLINLIAASPRTLIILIEAAAISEPPRCPLAPSSARFARPPFRFVIYSRVLRSIGFAGTPTTVTPAGTSLVTTAPAPITASWPMSSGFSSVPLTKTAPVPTLRGNEKDVGN